MIVRNYYVNYSRFQVAFQIAAWFVGLRNFDF